MAEKEEIDINASQAAELSSPEKLGLNGQAEIIPAEEETVEPLIILQDEVVSEEAQNKSAKLDSDTFNEAEVPSSLDNGEPEFLPEEPAAENSADTGDEPEDGESEPGEFEDDEFLGLDDEKSEDEPAKEQDPPQGKETLAGLENDEFQKKSEEDNQPAANQNDRNDNIRKSVKATKKSKIKTALKKPSRTKIIVAFTLLLMGIAGGAFYMKSSLIGFKREAQPVPLQAADPPPTVLTVQKQVESPKLLSENEKCQAMIDDAGLLRDELLEKKEEINRLKRHYQKGIADLEDQISRELQKESITTYMEALKNRRIELNLRTIQRRRSYIHGLEKPARWIKQGSEELLYLKRKAEFDLQLIDIAGGIDLDRHMRHIGAAIQKYRPSAEKLAVDRENTNLPPLETIWRKIENKKKKTGPALPNVTDREIIKEICTGNFARTAELTSMSAAAAQCLSKKNGSDLFLNNLPALSPEAAKHLSQWRGSWICINGLKELSPAAAQYLFKWEGNWLSLNGLTEFPPELATYLMEWEGKQLELMGLRFNNTDADLKALKYLALWETMGGKLFISDDVRKEIERVLM